MNKNRNNRQVGAEYEAAAAAFLEQKGLKILEKNYRCRTGEVDLIARDGDTLVFVEVKYRKSLLSGSALSAVDRRKQQVIARVARFYLLTRLGTVEVPCRFDVVGIDGAKLYWVKNAFEAE